MITVVDADGTTSGCAAAPACTITLGCTTDGRSGVPLTLVSSD